jgi:perosamine synthetase
MLVTNDQAIAQRARWKRDVCFAVQEEGRFRHREVGYNYRLSGLQAAFGLARLAHFDEVVVAEATIGDWYAGAALGAIEVLTLHQPHPASTHAHWITGAVVEPQFGTSRRRLQDEPRRRGVQTWRMFEAMHGQPLLDQTHTDAMFPNIRRLADQGLYSPFNRGLTESDVHRIADQVSSLRWIGPDSDGETL